MIGAVAFCLMLIGAGYLLVSIPRLIRWQPVILLAFTPFSLILVTSPIWLAESGVPDRLDDDGTGFGLAITVVIALPVLLLGNLFLYAVRYEPPTNSTEVPK